LVTDVDLGTGFLGMKVDDGLLTEASTVLEAADTWASPTFTFVAATGASSCTSPTPSLATGVFGGVSLLDGGGCQVICSFFAMKRCIAYAVDGGVEMMEGCTARAASKR